MLMEMYGLDDVPNKHGKMVESVEYSVRSSIKKFKNKHGHKPFVALVNPDDLDIYHMLCRAKWISIRKSRSTQSRHFYFVIIKRKPVKVVRREPV